MSMNFKERYQYDSKNDLLGSGGFSTVFLATDKLLNRKVALKFFPSSSNQKYSIIEEIRRVINLEHRNIARYYDATILEVPNVHGGMDSIEVGIMEYLDGGDLRTFLKKHNNDPAILKKLLCDILAGLSYLHEHGIIHRDLKPDNILVTINKGQPVAKIIDFGISKDSGGSQKSSSAILGSIEYMAPEQFNPAKYGIDGRISTNVDLWAWGLMVYELLSGTQLFGTRTTGDTSEQVMSNILQKDVSHDLGNIPEPWQAVIQRCLVRDASLRARRAEDLLELIHNPQASSNKLAASYSSAEPKQVSFVSTQVIDVKRNDQIVEQEQKVVKAGTSVVVENSEDQQNTIQRFKYWILGGIALVAICFFALKLSSLSVVSEQSSLTELQTLYKTDSVKAIVELRQIALGGSDSAKLILGNLFLSQGSYDSAVKYLSMVVDVFNTNYDCPHSILGMYLNNLDSNKYVHRKDSADKYYAKSIDAAKINALAGDARLATNCGLLYYGKDQYDSAKKYLTLGKLLGSPSAGNYLQMVEEQEKKKTEKVAKINLTYPVHIENPDIDFISSSYLATLSIDIYKSGIIGAEVKQNVNENEYTLTRFEIHPTQLKYKILYTQLNNKSNVGLHVDGEEPWERFSKTKDDLCGAIYLYCRAQGYVH